MKVYDYIIVGKGFGGGILALTLKQRNRTVLLIDDASQSQCSRVAAGMLSPVNFRSMAATWYAPVLAPFAITFYKEIENAYGKSIFTPRPLYRLLTETERDNWPGEKPFFGDIKTNPYPDQINAPYGFGEITDTGNLNAGVFQNVIDTLFEKDLLNEKFDETALQLLPGKVTYKSFEARYIVFCRGYCEATALLFPRLRFQLLKGELLRVKIPGLQLDEMLQGGGYLVPQNGDEYLFGATHEKGVSDENLTVAGRNELEQKLREMVRVPFDILQHLAGVRPTLYDHRPVLGIHPEHDSVAILNGLGSKGSFQAPWLAVQLIQLLEENKPLLREIDVKRFWK